MAPVTIHSDSPISESTSTTAKKPSGATPQTATPQGHLPSSSSATATTAATTTSLSAYQPQPGAVAGPAPTPTSSFTAAAYPSAPPPTRTALLQATSVTSSPPAPQPGAVPTAPFPSSSFSSSTVAAAAPSPSAVTAAYTLPTPQSMPSQFSVPPPTTNYAPTHSTESSTTAASSAAYTGPGGAGAQQSLAHPPGYVQNPYAMAMTPAQRAAQEEAERQESSFGNFASNLTREGGGASGGDAGPGLPRDPNLTSIGEDVNAAWNTAKSWMGTVAGKAAELEGEVWKKLGNE